MNPRTAEKAEPAATTELDQLCINSIRILSMDAVQQANSGHPGTPMALAPLGYLLWTRHLKHNPADSVWPDRDRFVLSCGHASMLLYSLLYLTGYDLSLEEIRDFRQWGSRTPGHPEYGLTPGVETTTGPLGQGFGNAVGMALAEARLSAEFNRDSHRVVDHHTWFIASDGDLMEGVSHEAASLAGHLRLGRLIGFFDDNGITIDGSTELSCSDDVEARFRSYGWHVQRVEDGNDLEALDGAMTAARQVQDRPSLIVVRTHIGFGSPHKQDTAEAHGAPLGDDEVEMTRENLGWPHSERFLVPDEVLSEMRKCRDRGAGLSGEWAERMREYEDAHPRLAAELKRRLAGELPAGWEDVLPDLTDAGPMATRAASGKIINALADRIPELVGGSADLSGSNNTLVKGASDVSASEITGRNIRFGIREHAMAGILNGMSLHGGLVPYGGTFLIFSDYMRPAIRLASLMQRGVIYVFTHDSIGLGEDGPTHQPVEQLCSLRLIPGLWVVRPADPAETVEAWRLALSRRDGPVALALTRQKVPSLDRDRLASAEGTARGGYVIRDSESDPELVVIATGSEVAPTLDAVDSLGERAARVRVVSMPCLEAFNGQDEAYRRSVLAPDVPRLAVEAGATMCWEAVVGDAGRVIGLNRFGASAPAPRLFEELGFSADDIAREIALMLDRP